MLTAEINGSEPPPEPRPPVELDAPVRAGSRKQANAELAAMKRTLGLSEGKALNVNARAINLSGSSGDSKDSKDSKAVAAESSEDLAKPLATARNAVFRALAAFPSEQLYRATAVLEAECLYGESAHQFVDG